MRAAVCGTITSVGRPPRAPATPRRQTPYPSRHLRRNPAYTPRILACALLLPLAACGGGSDSTGPGGGGSADVSGLWVDSSGAYLLRDQGHTWSCSTAGWLYVSSPPASGSVSSNTIACTTPIGNDLSWAGGSLGNLTQPGHTLAFDMSAGVFDASQTQGIGGTACHVTTTVNSSAMNGTQTCTLTYVDPFGLLGTAHGTVQGPFGAARASFGPDLASVGCSQEGQLTPAGLSGGTIVVFQNRTSQPLAIFPVDANGQRTTLSTPVPANSTVAQPIPAGYPLILTDAAGTCRAVYVSTTQPARAVMP